MLLVSLFFGPAETHSVTDNWTWLGPLWSSPSPWVNCYAIWYLENPPQVSLWYCTVAPVDLFTHDRNCTEGWLGPMWSSPSRYFDTCNLTFGPPLLILNVSSSLSSGKKAAQKTPGFFVIHLQPSGFGLRLRKPHRCLSGEGVTVSSRPGGEHGGPYGAHPMLL